MSDLFILICLVFSFIYLTSASEECYKEDFEDGSLGIMNRACVSASLFDVKKYKDYAEDLPKPNGANDYFISPGSAGLSCIDSRDALKVVIGTELELSLFTSNPGGTLYAFWLMIDTATGDQLSVTPIFIDHSRTWRTSVIKVTKNATVKIKLQSDDLKSKNAFLAIDYLRIKGPNAEDCIIKPTTTSTTLMTTSEDYTDITTPTTVVYTENTTPTTVVYTENTTPTPVDYTENTTPTTVDYTENTTPTTVDYTENTTPTTVDYTENTTPTTIDYIENTTPTTVDYTENTTPTTTDYTENTTPTTVDYTENTTPTTIDYTENTTPSSPPTVTPEPPPSITCNCNCNCNYQCNTYPFS